MRLLFICPPGRVKRLQRAREGESPTEFFFGGIEAEKRGIAVEYREVDVATWPPICPHVIDRWMDHAFSTHLAGRSLRGARKLAPTLPSADCIVIIEENLALGMAFLAMLRCITTPIVSIRCRLSMVNSGSPALRILTSCVIRATHTILMSRAEAETLPKRFSLKERHYSFNPFGVDESFWRPAERQGKFVLAVGDSFRDYETLLRAARYIESPVLIVTSQHLNDPLPENVTVRTGCWRKELLRDDELLDLYQRATCVVVPLTDRLDPTGQSVCLQAMSCARPVVMTKTRGLWDQNLRDGENVLLFSPGDSAGLAARVNRFVDDPSLAAELGYAGRESVCRHFRIADFAHRLEVTCRRLVEHRAAQDHSRRRDVLR
jgi:glycosyltransferase involved in cell wall biosynthesis